MLYLLRLAATPSSDGNGVSLSELYEKCLQDVQHDVIVEGLFLQRASELYGRASESQLKDRFKMRNMSLYDVRGQFPRLTRSNVSQEILNAGYSIAMSSLGKFEVAEDLKEVLQNG